MKIEVGDRVRALEDCRMAGRGPDRYFYREGDTGSVVRFDGLGAWVKWDNNHIDDGVWYANTEVLTLIEGPDLGATSGVDVLAVMEEAEANTYSALSGRIREARAVVDALANAAVDAAELLESVAPHHPQAANLRAALAQQPAPVAPVKVEAVADVLQKLRRLALVIREHGTCAPLALDHIGDDLERALAQQPAAPTWIGIDWAEGHTHPHEMSSGCHCVQCRPHERPCGCNGCRSLAGQPAAVVGVEQVASAIAIEDTGVSWRDVSPRDRTHYVKLARAALAAIAQQPAAVDEAALRNASRYRFLRNSTDLGVEVIDAFQKGGEELDAAVDAALAAQKGGDA